MKDCEEDGPLENKNTVESDGFNDESSDSDEFQDEDDSSSETDGSVERSPGRSESLPERTDSAWSEVRAACTSEGVVASDSPSSRAVSSISMVRNSGEAARASGRPSKAMVR